MNPIKQFNIPFVGLSFGQHTFEFDIDTKFFDAFQNSDIKISEGKAIVILDKKNTFFDVLIHVKGILKLVCDVSNEEFDYHINPQLALIVKFGETFNDDDDKILIIPRESYEINVAQYIYETVLLAIPMKKIHPGIADGTLKSPIIEKLKDYTVHEKPNIDPRWEQLNQLLTQKKQ